MIVPHDSFSLYITQNHSTPSLSRTTLVLKNLPRHFDKEALKDLLEQRGVAGTFPEGTAFILEILW